MKGTKPPCSSPSEAQAPRTVHVTRVFVVVGKAMVLIVVNRRIWSVLFTQTAGGKVQNASLSLLLLLHERWESAFFMVGFMRL